MRKGANSARRGMREWGLRNLASRAAYRAASGLCARRERAPLPLPRHCRPCAGTLDSAGAPPPYPAVRSSCSPSTQAGRPRNGTEPRGGKTGPSRGPATATDAARSPIRAPLGDPFTIRLLRGSFPQPATLRILGGNPVAVLGADGTTDERELLQVRRGGFSRVTPAADRCELPGS